MSKRTPKRSKYTTTSRSSLKSKLLRGAVTTGKVLLVVLVCILILEGVSRVILPVPPTTSPPVYELDAALCYKHIPSIDVPYRTTEFDTTVRINANGLRDEKTTITNDSILLFGDSFVFGSGVNDNETVAVRLEQALRRQGYANPVFNFGVGGYGNIQESVLLNQTLHAAHPAIVVLGFYLNDAHDNNNPCSLKVASDGYLIQNTTDERAASFVVRKWFQLHSNLYRASQQILYSLKVQTPLFDTIAGASKLAVPIEYNQQEAVYNPDTQQAWVKTNSSVRAFIEIAKENNVSVLVVFIPSKAIINTSLQDRLTTIYSLNHPDFRTVNRNVRRLAAEESVPFFDMTDAFIENGGLENYFIVDPHWTVRGNELAGETMADYLIREKMVTPSH